MNIKDTLVKCFTNNYTCISEKSLIEKGYTKEDIKQAMKLNYIEVLPARIPKYLITENVIRQ